MPATVLFSSIWEVRWVSKELVLLWITSIPSEEYFYQGKTYLSNLSRGTYSIILVNLTDKTYLEHVV